MEDEGFVFDFLPVSKNITLNQHDVIAYHFIIVGATSVEINNSLVLRAGSALSEYKEDIQQGQRTKQEYVIKWANQNNPLNNLMVITKKRFVKK